MTGARCCVLAALVLCTLHTPGSACAAIQAAAADREPLAAPASEADPGPASPFGHQTVMALARALAAAPFEAPPAAPAELRALDYDSYRQLRYRKQAAIWGASPTRFSIELFAPGFLYGDLVQVAIVENGRVRPLTVEADSFETPSPEIAEVLGRTGRFAGFRLHYPINRRDYRDEFLVFQGASYFRAVSRGQRYGLSARGLALDVAEPHGEEFPLFRQYWIERPARDANAIVVHALLDSESVAGAYRFAVYPGRPTTLDVNAVLFPRRPLTHVGLAPLTSMFLHGAADPPTRADYRPAVHDSEGLALRTGTGERLWRPLTNPSSLQLSAFLDRDPEGFGLVQRSRTLAHFEDLEARYGQRPSAWVRPLGAWGAGHVQLLEIPSASETNDNVVSYWRPAAPLAAGEPYAFAYRLTWPDDPDTAAPLARVVRSARSQRLADGLPQVVVDHDGGGPAAGITADVSLSAGELVEVLVQDRDGAGLRTFVTFDPQATPLVELRLQLRDDSGAVGETWLYRWLEG